MRMPNVFGLKEAQHSGAACSCDGDILQSWNHPAMLLPLAVVLQMLNRGMLHLPSQLLNLTSYL